MNSGSAGVKGIASASTSNTRRSVKPKPSSNSVESGITSLVCSPIPVAPFSPGMVAPATKSCDGATNMAKNASFGVSTDAGRDTKYNGSSAGESSSLHTGAAGASSRPKHLLSSATAGLSAAGGGDPALKPCESSLDARKGEAPGGGTQGSSCPNGTTTPNKKQRGGDSQPAPVTNPSGPGSCAMAEPKRVPENQTSSEQVLSDLGVGGMVVEGQQVNRYLDPSGSEPGQLSPPPAEGGESAVAPSLPVCAGPPVLGRPTASSVPGPDLANPLSGLAVPPGLAAAVGLVSPPPAGEAAPEGQRDRLVQLIRAFMLAKHVRTDSLPCKVMEGLFVGSVGAAYNKPALEALGISAIVVVANSLHPLFPDSFSYTVVDVLDSPEVDLTARFEECFEAIDAARNAGGAALVHCFAGRSRSVTVVTAYVMSRLGLNRDAALDLVRQMRPEACPNAGFLHQLLLWEDRLRMQGVISGRSLPGDSPGAGPVGGPKDTPAGPVQSSSGKGLPAGAVEVSGAVLPRDKTATAAPV